MFSSNVSVETAKFDALNIDSLLKDNTSKEGVSVKAKTCFDTYSMAQPALFSNENNDYIHRSKTNDGVALMVAGSFDQAVDLALLGYSTLIAVDINRYQYYIGYLKYLAVKYLNYFQFIAFLADAQSPRCLDEGIIRFLFDEAEVHNEPSKAAPEMFWKTLLRKNTNAIQIRMKYIMGEKNYILNASNRALRSKYIVSSKSYNDAQKALGKMRINFYIGNVFNVSKDNFFPEHIYDVVLLSNIHNFVMANTYVQLVRDLVPYVKVGGSIYSYIIQIPREWIEKSNSIISYIDRKKTNWPKYQDLIECQAAHRSYFVEAFKRQFCTRVHEVETCGGYACAYNTSTDSILEIIV